MQIEYLHYLLDIYNLRSISTAARYLHIAQTTLSAAVKSVEDELGFPVFRRTPSGVVPTEKGRLVLDLAWKVTALYESLMRLRDHSKDPPQFFNILVSPVLPPFILSGIAEKFAQFHSFGNICFEEHPSKEIGSAVANRVVGIGVAVLTKHQYSRLQTSFTYESLSTEMLFEDEMACITALDSPLSVQGFATVEDLRNAHLILPYAPQDNDSGITDLLPHLTNFSIMPDISLLLAGVSHYGFTSILPQKIISQEPFVRDGGCRSVPIRDEHYDPSVCACLCSRPFERLNLQEQLAYFCIRDFCARMQHGTASNDSEVQP